MKKIIRALSLAALLFSAASCAMEEEIKLDPRPELETRADVLLHLKTPRGFAAPGTRSLTFAQENNISDVWVLVFDADSKLIDIKQGQADGTDPLGGPNDEYTGPGGATDYSGKGSFKVTLPQSTATGASATSNLVVLANAGTILGETIGTDFSAYTGNKGYDQVIAAISQDFTEKYPNTTIPMWGETGQTKILPTTSPTVTLVRAIARIDVGVGASPEYDAERDYPWTWDGKNASDETIPFQLKSVHVIRPNDKYAVAPASANRTGTKATAPTLPAETNVLAAEASRDAFGFSGADVTADRYTTQSIYVPEFDHSGTPGDADHTKRMAIVVGGIYDANANGNFADDGAVSYYRLDFATLNSTTQKAELMDVLRNHLYQFNILKVSGKGYPDVITAYEARSMNMTVEILEWDESDMGNIVFDGQYFLSVNEMEWDFLGEAVDASAVDNLLTVTTDYPTWKATVWDTPEGTGETSRAWLSLNTTGTSTVEGEGDYPAKDELELLLTANESGTGPRTAYVEIESGRLRTVITVRQEAPGVKAVPGVIGYYVTGPNKGKLTLDGDKDSGGPNTTERVYVAYFKGGSTIAITSQNNGPFTARDIVAAPAGYRGAATAAEATANLKAEVEAVDSGLEAYNKVPKSPGSANTGDLFPTDPELAYGDACTVWFGNGWRLPTRQEYWDDFFPGLPSPYGLPGTSYTYTENGRSVIDPATATFLNGAAAGLKLPFAGLRAGNAVVEWQGVIGPYWTSTADNDNANAPRSINVMENYHDYSAVGYSLSLNESMAIRCVKSNPTLTVNPAPTSVPHTGGTASISFDSSITGVKQGLTETTAAAPWTAQFSLDGGATWTTTAPEWIDGFPTSGTGSLPPTSYTVGTAPVTGISPDFEGESALGTQAAPYDLSTENGARPRETANSYVVNGPGYYKLPLVYGNAVKNGAPNEAAYRSTLGNPTITVPNMVYLTRFLRHDGQPIADPYINANSFAGGVATNATLVWSDVPGMVAVDAAIASEGGVDFLTFRVSDESIAQGNAVVAVRNTAGQIMWSWHIWVTEPRIADMHKAEALAQAQLTENRSTTMSTSYKMMANNLGWVEARENTHAARTVQVRITQQATGGMSKTFAIEQAAGSSTLGANNPYWQFGRKDPMLPSNGHAGHGGEREAIEYGAGYAAPEMIRKRDGSIANAIQNPNVFYLAATNFGTARWNHTGTGDGNSDAKDVINLWSMDDVDPALNSEVVKTVYDPSPVGFTVPNKDVFTGFTSTGGEINEKTDWNIPDPSTNSLGQKFHLGLAKTGDTAFYPEMGDRGVDDGILYNVNNGGNAFYHTASMLGETFCVGLLFTSAGTYLNPKYGNFISRGSSVRPAAEVTP